MMHGDRYSDLSVFAAGVCVGAGLVLLLAPASRDELLELLGTYARSARDELLERGKEALHAALEQGRDYLESDVRGSFGGGSRG